MNPNVTPNAAALIRLAREGLRQANANLCRHKIDRARAKCAECEKPAPKPAPVEQEQSA